MVVRRHEPRALGSTIQDAAVINVMEPMGSMSLSPSNNQVALGAKNGLFVLDLDNPYALPRFFAHRTTGEVADIQWNPHDVRKEWVASTSNQKLIIWNLNRSESTSAAVRPDMLAPKGRTRTRDAGVSPRAVRINQFASTPTHSKTQPGSAVEHILERHSRAITDINWSPLHPAIVASCSMDTWAWVWDLRASHRRAKPAQGYSAWNASMTQIKWNRVTPHRIAASCDNKVLIWDDRFGALPLATIEAHRSKIYGLQWSPNVTHGRDQLLTCSLDGTIKHWDIGTDVSRTASSQREMISVPQSTILTHDPVWRAKYLPFGDGVMSVAQRGDTAPSLWAHRASAAPAKHFVGHTDIVREFLFRTRRGTSTVEDDREFQLLTWSKDQTLRMWPIGTDVLEAVGHCKGAPIPFEKHAVLRKDAKSSALGITKPALHQDSASIVIQSPEDALGFDAAGALLPRSLGASLVTSSAEEVGPRMRYQEYHAHTGFHDPVNWMARVRIERGNEGGDEAAPPSTAQVDCVVLPDEIMRVGDRFPHVFEMIDVVHRRCTIAVHGPWAEHGQSTAYVRVVLTFPSAYPNKPPSVEVERNPTIPLKTRAELQSALVDVVEEKSVMQACCIEACLDALVAHGAVLQSTGVTNDTAAETNAQDALPMAPQNNNRFLHSYQAVADAVVRLTLRASDTSNAQLLESDVVQLLSTNVLNRAMRSATTDRSQGPRARRKK
ncbi:hypothetical protein MVES1_000166 [Malassezia vespertilionis]|uniref:RWD domain-containing protein n=1 Tax=Malassezia vespertilionis TaxID=2020962 RepID=A0A2N1JHB8_9BASI|nr:uncharacterized protein MVES1_000166 [Malassezia vespertilionis]PKI85933.1 hypothetical protein MVES_000162 [Malassezia vespertilionis]WFD04842.1 hypothetical protein MVES1_000166 [Malassezia vespertilionis]